MHTKKEVAIVGGGLAGLSAAVYLNRKGVTFDLYEQSKILGGRVYTAQMDGFLLDAGFQIFLDSYEEAEAIMDFNALGLKSAGSGAIIHTRGKWRKFGNPLKKPLDIFPTLFSGIGAIKDKFLILKLSRFVASKNQEDFQKLPNVSTMDFLKNYGFSEGIQNDFFKPFFGGVFLEFELKTSSRLFLYLFKKFAEGEATLPRNGMKAIVDQLVDQLPEEAIHLGSEVSTLESEQLNSYKQVILAVNEKSFNRLTNKQSKLNFNGTTCFYFSTQKIAGSDLDYLHLNPNGKLVKHVCFMNRIQSSYAPAGRDLLSVTVQANNNNIPQDAVANELKELFGSKLQDLKFLKKYEIPEALSFYDGEFKELNTDKNGPIYCGDHMLYPSINGAIKSGRMAAEEAISRLA